MLNGDRICLPAAISEFAVRLSIMFNFLDLAVTKWFKSQVSRR